MKFLFRDEIKKIIDEAPEGTDPREIIAGLLKKGFVLEGIGDFKSPIKGDPGKDGKDYVLTEEDKQEIASLIKVPVVEKVVEKKEVIREVPVVKETIKETVKEDSEEVENLKKEIEELKKRPPQIVVESSGGFIETPIKAGTGTTVTKDAFGNWVISATSSSGDSVPTGTMLMWGGSTASVPTGYLWADGSAVSRTTYSALFAAIGTTWGVGNGSTTFNLPGTKARYPRGTDNNLYTVGTMTNSNAEGHDLSGIISLNTGTTTVDANLDGNTVDVATPSSLSFSGNLEVHGVVETFVPVYIIKT